jgi:hypothetical protein
MLARCAMPLVPWAALLAHAAVALWTREQALSTWAMMLGGGAPVFEACAPELAACAVSPSLRDRPVTSHGSPITLSNSMGALSFSAVPVEG